MTNDPERTGDRGLLRSVPSPSEKPPKARTRKSASATAGTARKRAGAEPAHDQIARRAFEIYVSRGGGHGRHREDWLLAEAELRRAAQPGEPSR